MLRYCTWEDDIFSKSLQGESLFLNPACGARKRRIGCSGIGRVLDKLIGHEVRCNGCKLTALVPAFTHTEWFGKHVLTATRIYRLTEQIRFTNAFLAAPPTSTYMYPQIVCVGAALNGRTRH